MNFGSATGKLISSGRKGSGSCLDEQGDGAKGVTLVSGAEGLEKEGEWTRLNNVPGLTFLDR